MVALVQRLRRPALVTGYGTDLRLFKSNLTRIALLVLAALYFVIPAQLSDFQLDVLNRVGIFAIGALGLNLLTGYTGQVSLGHAFFMAIGAYTWAHFGNELGWSLLLWLPLAGVLGAVVGAMVGPFALRLRGNYLAIVSLGLIFIGTHIWLNWESLTGGTAGTPSAASGGRASERAAEVFGLDFDNLVLNGLTYTTQQGFFWLIWALVIVLTIIAKNIVRTRPGRALQAVRDRDVAAAVIGIDLRRYKVAAFALSSAYAAMCGAIFGSYYGYVSPDQWNLFLSIQFIAIIIVGGVGTIFGSIVGALFIAGSPPMIEEYADKIPLISTLTESGGLSTDSLNQILYGLVIILFLVLEPHGLAGVWFRIKAYFKTWPFSY